MQQKTDITEFITDLEVTEGFVNAEGGRPTIFKKILTGYASIKEISHMGASWVKTKPVFQMDAGEEIEEFGLELQQNETIVAMVPPAKFTVGVWAFFPEPSTTFEVFKTDSYDLDLPVFLGFEYDHVEHPKWVAEYKKKLMSMFHESKTLFDF